MMLEFMVEMLFCLDPFIPPDKSSTFPRTPYFFFFSYNKVLAWADVLLELMVEKLFFFIPSLPETLGDLTPNLQVRW